MSKGRSGRGGPTHSGSTKGSRSSQPVPDTSLENERSTADSGIFIPFYQSAITYKPAEGSGVVVAPEKRPPATLAAPGTHTVDMGGMVKTAVHVGLVFWGSVWGSTLTVPSMGNVIDAVINILSGNYLDGLAQYRNCGTNGRTLLSVSYISYQVRNSPANPPNPFSEQDVQNFIQDALSQNLIAISVLDPAHLICVIMPPKVNYTDSSLGGNHSFLRANDPFIPIKTHYSWVGNDGTLNFVSSLFSHELAEAMTDPEGNSFQVSGSSRCTPNPTTWCEIGDVCGAWQLLNGVSVETYWSDNANRCIV
jgi:hypothetical protein